MDLIEIIRCVDLFERLTTAELDEIIAICHQRRFQKGELLDVEEDIGDEIFIVMEGIV